MWLRDVLLDTRFVLLASIVAAFVFHRVGAVVGEYIVFFIGAVMTISMRKVSLSGLTSYTWRDVSGLLAVNYVGLSAVYFAVAWLFFDGLNQSSIIVLGLMPPAVGVISLTYLLDGEMDTSFVAELAGYGLSLVLIPVGMVVAVGDTVSLWRVVEVLVYMIVVPFVLSRGLRFVDHRVPALSEDRFKALFNVCYGAVFYGSIALNREAIVSNPWMAGFMAAVLLGLRLAVSTGVHLWLKDRLRHPLDVDYVLFSTFKNGGAALGFVVMLFGANAALPLAVNASIVPVHIVFVESVLLPFLR